MNDYRVEPIGQGMWAIDDESEDSLYLIEGTERALLIDTGMSAAPLTPLLRTLTDRPVDLALTHAHIDHMQHSGEFERASLHRADIDAWRRSLGLLYRMGCMMFHVPNAHPNPRRFMPLDDGSVIELGGRSIRVIHAPGHTPGSCIFADDAAHALFTGDAFGSGEAAWMWMPGCANVRCYRDSLRALLPKLEPMADYRFFGGHRLQGVRSEKHPHAYPLTIQVPQDMLTLCEEILSGRALSKRSNLLPVLRLRVYSHGHASMVHR